MKKTGLGFLRNRNGIAFIAIASILMSVQVVCAVHHFAVSNEKNLAVIGQDGSCVWEYPTKKSYVFSLLKNKNILLTTKYSAKCISMDKEVVWEYKPGGEVFGAVELADGRIAVAECTNKKVSILDATGQKLSSFPMKLSSKTDSGAVVNQKKREGSNHRNSRAVTATPQNTLLVGHLGECVVREYSLDGRVLDEFKCNSMAYMGVRLENGNTLLASKNRLTEVDSNKKEVWYLEAEDIPEIKLAFITAVERLENGNTIICNWYGHGFKGNASIFEVTPKKEVVWKFTDLEQINTPTAFFQLTGSDFRRFKQ